MVFPLSFIVQDSFHIYSSIPFCLQHSFLLVVSHFRSGSSSTFTIMSHCHLDISLSNLNYFSLTKSHLGLSLIGLSCHYHALAIFCPLHLKSMHPCHFHLRACSFISLTSPPPPPFIFTHWESGGWSRFIRHYSSPSFEGSPVFLTVCHTFRRALRNVLDLLV